MSFTYFFKASYANFSTDYSGVITVDCHPSNPIFVPTIKNSIANQLTEELKTSIDRHKIKIHSLNRLD